MRIAVVAVFLSLAAVSVRAQSPWMGPAGGGMLSVQEARVLWPGHAATGLACDNYDRDPLGIDVYECHVAWRLGLARRWEAYGSYQISRAVSVPGAVPAPSPPLDIMVLPGARIPDSPYRAMYWPMPYLSQHSATLNEMIGGEYTFGVKTILVNQHRLRPAVSVNAQFTVPGTLAPYELSRGSGSGSVDVSLFGASTWRLGRVSVSANAGVTHNSRLRRSDRIIIPGSGAVDLPIRRPDFLHLGVGTRVRIWRGISAMVETAGWAPWGAHTPMLDESGAHDVLGGMQFNWKGVSLTAAVRQHLNPPPNGTVRPTGPLAGAVDLSRLSEAARTQWLQSIGLDGDNRRPGANLVVMGVPGSFVLPPGAKRVADTYSWHTTGNGAIIFSLSFAF